MPWAASIARAMRSDVEPSRLIALPRDASRTMATISSSVRGSRLGFVKIPAGTSAQRPASPSLGMIRYNSDISSYEGYGAGSAWSSLGGVKSVDQNTYVTASDNGNIDFYSNTNNVVTVDTEGVKIKTTTAATGSQTGALQVAGGVSIEGALYVQGNLATSGGLQSDGYLALEGNPDYGATGYGFIDDNDTGMFSEGDGYVQFWSNNTLAATITPNAGAFILNTNTPLKFGNWVQLSHSSNDFIINFEQSILCWPPFC